VEYEKITATALAKQLGVSVKTIFNTLSEANFVCKQGNDWILTDEGRKAGAEERKSQKYGTFLIWPKDLLSREEDSNILKNATLSSTKLGGKLGLTANRINRILNEIGWIDRGVKGWKITLQGEKYGGVQKQHHQTGVPFVVWPESILENPTFLSRTKEDKGAEVSQPTANDSSQFRERFKAELRTTDGHYVRSRAEMLIDNWLYMSEIAHAYERKLPIEEEAYCDFYLPNGKVYIEFWGLENDPKYIERKKTKIALYEKFHFNLIQLHDKDIANIDDILPRELLRYDIQTF
jgi:hypothetical protein